MQTPVQFNSSEIKIEKGFGWTNAVFDSDAGEAVHVIRKLSLSPWECLTVQQDLQFHVKFFYCLLCKWVPREQNIMAHELCVSARRLTRR